MTVKFRGVPEFDLLQFLFKDFDDQLQQTRPETPGPNSLDLGNAATLHELNQREFLHFEVKYGLVFAGQDDHAAAWDSSTITEIRKHVEKQLEYFEDRVQTSISSSPPDSRNTTLSGGILNVHGYVRHIVENGSRNEEFQRAFLPTTPEQWESTVVEFTSSNEFFEQQYARASSDTSYERHYGKQTDVRRCETVGAHAEALYELLLKRPESCMEDPHDAFLQLPALSWNFVYHKVIFNMLLSPCSNTGLRLPKDQWQETICTYTTELQRQSHSRAGDTNICSQVRTCKEEKRALYLSFDTSTLWINPVPPEHCLLGLQTPRSISLADLLEKGLLQGDDLNIRVKRYRLALSLASSLNQLYSGPWIQENWSPNLFRFFYESGSEKIQNLDQPYVPCTFIRSWKHKNTVFKESQQSMDLCPDFFLSFAQLLMDIGKGEWRTRPSTKENTPNWKKLLASELDYNFQDTILQGYRKSIEGCLQYSQHYKHEANRIRNPRARAQTVIHEKIVLPLQRNLRWWEKERDAESQSLNLAGTTESSDVPFPSLTVSGEPRKLAGIVSHPMDRAAASLVTDPPTDITQFTLFADEDAIYVKREDTSTYMNKFITLLERHGQGYISRLPVPSTGSGTDQNIRVAVLDTGLRIDESDNLLSSAATRVIKRKNFVEPMSEDCSDNHGHGTHVARILLRFAPRAEVAVGKVSAGKSLKQTRLAQLVEALKWAGDNADIINLSFGLGHLSIPSIKVVIQDLIRKGKLIFAAASNSGGNGPRAYPASEPGVFCIHATDENGDKARGMNPAPLDRPEDNFSTLGVNINSFWDGKDVSISGTSFATPIAAAIAANALEFVRRTLTAEYDRPDFFMRYKGMRDLFRAMADSIDGYDYVKPWKAGLWDERSDIFQKLMEISTYV